MQILSALLLSTVLLAGCMSRGAETIHEPRTMIQRQPGVFAVPEHGVDLLLGLEQYPGLRVLVVEQPFERVSDAHVLRLREWVFRGGVVWLQAPALEDGAGAFRLLTPIQVGGYKFYKSATGERGGELVVRGASPRFVIGDHTLTQGVRELYVYPRLRFDGTLHADPLLQFSDPAGNQGVVLAAVQVGEGLVVLDGTARERGRVFDRIPGFDPEHPNAVLRGNTWHDYDWHQLVVNAYQWAEQRLRAEPMGG